jgi:2-keto-4-pentenoate hydratase
MLDRLLEMRRTHRKAPLPSPSVALDVAYRVQDELREALVARGERVIGWKAGLTGRIAQERGLGLRAGDLVMSGSISALLRPKAGDVVTARFTRLGSVSARFV